MVDHPASGDDSGLPIPVDLNSMRDLGADFLTRAFRSYGALGTDTAVAGIRELRSVGGGSTGTKALLSIDYDARGSALPTELFVKFSRDLDNPDRDLGRHQMGQEVRFAGLTRRPDFPITVPRTLFADHHRESGTGILVTERIPFGVNGIEPQHHKCSDYLVPDVVDHYRSIVTALASLAGWHRRGGAGDTLEQFPVDLDAATVGDRPPLQHDRLSRQLDRLSTFVCTHPDLFPAHLRTATFLAEFTDLAHVVVDREPHLWRWLVADHDHVALCHWNANIDNAWFWRDDAGELRCGLFDWGCASRMNVAMALSGAFAAAEIEMWDRHLEELCDLFASGYHAAGGPLISPEALRDNVIRYSAAMGVFWLLGVPTLVDRRLGASAQTMSRMDPAIRDDESIRAPLQMLATALNLWQSRPVAALLSALP